MPLEDRVVWGRRVRKVRPEVKERRVRQVASVRLVRLALRDCLAQLGRRVQLV